MSFLKSSTLKAFMKRIKNVWAIIMPTVNQKIALVFKNIVSSTTFNLNNKIIPETNKDKLAIVIAFGSSCFKLLFKKKKPTINKRIKKIRQFVSDYQ